MKKILSFSLLVSSISSQSYSTGCDQSYYLSFHNDNLPPADKGDMNNGVIDNVNDVFKFYKENYSPRSSAQFPRAHIANISAEEIRVKSPKLNGTYITLTPKVVGIKDNNVPDILFCSEVLGSSPSNTLRGPSCQAVRSFNKYTTLDLTFSQHSVVVMHAWLETKANSNEALVGHNGISSDNQKYLHQSDTFFVVDSERPFAIASSQFTCGSSDLHVEIVLDDVEHVLTTRLWEATDYQQSVAEFCDRLGIGSNLCAGIAAAVVDRVRPHALLAQLKLPPPQALPTVEEPFVFLHHEKTGGSSLRSYIAGSAARLGLKFYVPCFKSDGTGPYSDIDPRTSEACMNFDLSKLSDYEKANLSVIGGHFEWNIWNQRMSHSPLVISSPIATTPRVFVMFRNPVRRAISLYYDRFYPVLNQRLNDFSEDKLKDLLFNFLGSFDDVWRDEGFVNTTCKMMCGLNIHKGLKHISFEQQQEAASTLSLPLALERLKLCVVGFTERWDETKQVISFWYPWLDVTSQEVRENYAKVAGIETPDTLKPSHLELIQSVNSCDLALHEKAKEIFEKQLAVIRA